MSIDMASSSGLPRTYSVDSIDYTCMLTGEMEEEVVEVVRKQRKHRKRRGNGKQTDARIIRDKKWLIRFVCSFKKNSHFHTHFVLAIAMAEEGLRFRRNVKIDDKEESVDLLTLALKKNAEYNKVRPTYNSLMR